MSLDKATPPTKYGLKSLRLWLQIDTMGDGFLNGVEASTWSEINSDDFITIQPHSSEPDKFSEFLNGSLLSIYNILIGRHSKVHNNRFQKWTHAHKLAVREESHRREIPDLWREEHPKDEWWYCRRLVGGPSDHCYPRSVLYKENAYSNWACNRLHNCFRGRTGAIHSSKKSRDLFSHCGICRSWGRFCWKHLRQWDSVRNCGIEIMNIVCRHIITDFNSWRSLHCWHLAWLGHPH